MPKECVGYDSNGKAYTLNNFWRRRQCTKFNGTAYVVQRGAEAVYTPEGQGQIRANIEIYRGNAALIRQGLEEAGLKVSGGENAPYIWSETPNGMSSWDTFDLLLREAGVVTTPGAGFGPCGEGYFRLSAFGDPKKVPQAMTRIRIALGR